MVTAIIPTGGLPVIIIVELAVLTAGPAGAPLVVVREIIITCGVGARQVGVREVGAYGVIMYKVVIGGVITRGVVLRGNTTSSSSTPKRKRSRACSADARPIASSAICAATRLQ